MSFAELVPGTGRASRDDSTIVIIKRPTARVGA
jgi:hypothetical protein